ncbi:type II toxin-antitoxin system RelE/ParE family toxin [Candidatus Pacearchaeota archaeon]|nr:type II toxin-antitoxin system RelE/ParE family toxin [Candidatus Pacearchaeota archaeon]
MGYEVVIPEHIDKIFKKISKKDKLQFEIITRKMQEILENPYRFKPLTANMAGQRRVHIRHFVLTYEILEEKKIIKILDYDHHDKVYEN